MIIYVLFREPVTNDIWTATGQPGFDAGSRSSLFIYLFIQISCFVRENEVVVVVVVAAKFHLKLLSLFTNLSRLCPSSPQCHYTSAVKYKKRFSMS